MGLHCTAKVARSIPGRGGRLYMGRNEKRKKEKKEKVLVPLIGCTLKNTRWPKLITSPSYDVLHNNIAGLVVGEFCFLEELYAISSSRVGATVIESNLLLTNEYT